MIFKHTLTPLTLVIDLASVFYSTLVCLVARPQGAKFFS